VVFAITHVDFKMWLPFMEEPFFQMKHFVVTAGQLVAVVVIGFLTLLNCRGVQEGKIVQNVMTVAKTLALIALIVVGIFLVGGEPARSINQADWFGRIEHTDAFEKVSGIVGENWLIVALMVMGGAMVGALFSADAWNNITFTAGEIKNPRRNLPLSLALGTGSVVLLYILANWGYVESLPVQGDKTLRAPFERRAAEALKKAETLTKEGKLVEAQAARDLAAEEARQADKFRRDEQNEKEAKNAAEEARKLAELGKTKEAEEARAREDVYRQQAAFYRGIDNARDERVGTAVMELVSPRFGARFMAIAIMISTFGCVNGMILMGARLYYVMAQDNLFFRSVGTLNNRGVPATGLILQGLWSILLVFTGKYGDLLDYVIFAVLVFYVLTVTGLFILRRTQPIAERPYKAFGYPVLPALYVFLCAVIMVDLLIVKPQYTWPGLIIVLTGIPVYFLWRMLGKKTAPT
jgi:amino acid transporter